LPLVAAVGAPCTRDQYISSAPLRLGVTPPAARPAGPDSRGRAGPW